MLNLQIGQILTLLKTDLSGVWACFQAKYMPNSVRFAQSITENMPEMKINLRLKKVL